MIKNNSGHIVNIGSIAGKEVYPNGNVYCATKHAVAAFSEGLRQEFSVRSNIRVTSIEPGVVDTELNDTITDKSLEGFIENAKKMEGKAAGASGWLVKPFKPEQLLWVVKKFVR